MHDLLDDGAQRTRTELLLERRTGELQQRVVRKVELDRSRSRSASPPDPTKTCPLPPQCKFS